MVNSPVSLIRLLGVPRLEGEAGVLTGPATQRHRIALLALLACAPHALLSRERLQGLLWPETTSGKARHLLNVAVHSLRDALGVGTLVSEGKGLRLDRSTLRIDTIEFEAALERSDAKAAVSQYTGPFLEGLYLPDADEFEQWAELERARLERLYMTALEGMADSVAQLGMAADAVHWWQRRLSHTPAEGRVVCELMRALANAGDRAGALQVAISHTELLANEFGARADPAVSKMADQLRQGTAFEKHTPGELSNGALRAQLAPDLELIRALGEGLVAHVYLAREPALTRLVAVKVLRNELAVDEVARLRFEREAQTAASLSHNHVITIHRVGRLTSGDPYIVMEYVDGRTLAELLHARGPLTVHEARRVLIAVADALSAAHSKGIVHRDVRPANIMHETATDRIVLVDFGIAALLQTEVRLVRPLTGPGDRLGDPHYLSPEQLRGEQVTPQCDVYALGVLSYELLTGAPPFKDASNLESLMGQLAWEPRPLRELRADVDEELTEVTRRCLAKLPGHRPRAREVYNALLNTTYR